jgi:hypothetical protein
MERDFEKLPSVHCFLDIVNKFVAEVPIQDKEWQTYRKDALWALKIVKTMLLPTGQQYPCKGRPSQRVVQLAKPKQEQI